ALLGAEAKPNALEGAPEDHMNLLEELADFCQTAGELPTALEYYSQILQIAVRASSGDLITQTALKMAVCFLGTGEFDRALEMLNLALQRCDADEAPIQRARVLSERSHVYLRKGEYGRAAEDAREALAILRAKTMSPELAEAFRSLGMVGLRTGEMLEAREAFEASLAISRTLDDRQGMAKCYNNLALVCKNRGHLTQAAEFQNKALAIARDLGNKLQIGIRLNNLGIIEFKRGRWEAARESWEEALRIFRELGNKWEVSLGHLNVAHYHRVKRRWQEAEESYGRALESSRENEHRRCEALYHEYFGELCLRRGELDRAERILTDGLALARRLGETGDLVGEILRRRGEVYTLKGDDAGALGDLRAALAITRRLGDRFETAAVLRTLGHLSLRRGHPSRAARRFRRSLEMFSEIGARYEQALSAVALGEAARETREGIGEAREALAAASESFRETGADYEAALADLLRAEFTVARGEGRSAIETIERVRATIESQGTEEERARLRDARSKADRLIVSSSVSESNSLSTFNLLLQRIRSIADTEERLAFTLGLLLERTEARRLVLVVPGSAEDALETAETRVVPDGDANGAVEVARAAVEHAMHNGGRPIYSTDPSHDSRFDSSLSALERVGSLLTVPLGGGEESRGGIYLDRPCGSAPFGQDDLDFAVALSSIVFAILQDLRSEAILRENLRLRRRLGIGDGFERIVTQSPRVFKIIETLQKLRDSTATILLQGETGTGKELFARAIHLSSSRKERPFVTVNCAELSEDVLESELFGHRKGAFTDAKESKIGLFERASGGTVFIDEIDKASRRFQDALLRVVDRKEIKPVGANDSISIDVRILCAANKDLRTEVENDRFLKDLYYRLRVVSIYLPPLRERKEDIPVLAEHFLSKHALRAVKRFDGFLPETMRYLIAYDWPGNVRDLEHEIERIVAVSGGGAAVRPEDLSPEITRTGPIAPASGTLGEVVERIERQMIEETLHRCGGNKSRAARRLGISRRGLLNKLGRYRIR
ncbi:MAG: sigma 54-interacting transcriptional regulator, partial [Candidatus Eisenbacteria bacterium]